MTAETESFLSLSAAADALGAGESELFEALRAAAIEAERPTARD